MVQVFRRIGDYMPRLPSCIGALTGSVLHMSLRVFLHGGPMTLQCTHAVVAQARFSNPDLNVFPTDRCLLPPPMVICQGPRCTFAVQLVTVGPRSPRPVAMAASCLLDSVKSCVLRPALSAAYSLEGSQSLEQRIERCRLRTGRLPACPTSWRSYRANRTHAVHGGTENHLRVLGRPQEEEHPFPPRVLAAAPRPIQSDRPHTEKPPMCLRGASLAPVPAQSSSLAHCDAV
ncbi:hypothetical protein OH76DRAFT_819732 [Lentinus brumalis]|uniref:Uncharacterized protein n=1 Tax=Lentinus brumalis TaxID=2498619 RepID=A0A371D2R7_9APHY|nr:hypothetical protein OH76DRAFT_819732 [Polyporus brumalis]